MPLRLCLLALLGLLVCSSAEAQDHRLLPAEDWTTAYIMRLQRHGYLLGLSPTASPYRQGDVWDALQHIDSDALSRTERHWVGLLERAVRPVATEADEAAVGLWGEAGIRAINSERLNPMRPLGDSLHGYWYLTMPNFYAEAGPVIAEFGLRADSYYDKDPDGLDTALRLFGRSDNTYVGAHHRWLSVYLGRFSNHWGVPGEAATLVSSNPRSQDQIRLHLGSERLSITGILTELDSITESGFFTGRAADTTRVGNRRRFLAAHRWDWRPTRKVALTFMESAIYSGINSGLSLKYINPLHPFIFVVDNTPKNDENNGLVAGMVWAQYRRLTLHGQLTVDDIDSRGESDETLSFAFAGSLVYSGMLFDAGGTLEAVTARTYNAPQLEGDYVYLQRGLATQFSDYVHASLFADLYLDALLPGLQVTPRLHVLAQGERDIRQPFPPKGTSLDNLLDGTAERTVRPAVQVAYQRVPWWWIRLDGGVNFVTNARHVDGATNTRFAGQVDFGVRLSLDRAYRLTF